ncbi:MAG: hypothetical protein ACK518_02880 [bacterium]
MISILLGIAFIALSLPQTYIYADKLLKSIVRMTYDDAQGMPTIYGILIHAFAFVLLYEILTRTKYAQKTHIMHSVEKIEDKKMNSSTL